MKDDTPKTIAIAMYDIYMNEVMFPIQSTAARTAALAVDILRQILPHVHL